MATDDTTKKVTTTSEKTGVAIVATMALAALFQDHNHELPPELRRKREAYKRAQAARRERNAS